MFFWEQQVLESIERGDYDGALVFLRARRDQSSDDAELCCIQLNEAECLRELGDFKQALKLLEELTKKSNASVYDKCVYLLCGAKCLEGLGRFGSAKRRLQEIKDLDLEGDFTLDLGFSEINIQFAEGKLREAIDSADRFLTKHEAVLRQNEYTEKAYKLELRVACELVNDGQNERALQIIRRVLPHATEGDVALLYLYAGVALEALGKSTEAIESFQAVLRQGGPEEQLARANYHLGAQYLRAGAGAWAKQHFLEAERLGLPPDISPVDLYRFLADACSNLREFQERERYMRQARQ